MTPEDLALLEADTEKPSATITEPLEAELSEVAQSAPLEQTHEGQSKIKIEDLLPQASPETEQPNRNQDKFEDGKDEEERGLGGYLQKSPSPKKSPVKSERSPSPAKVNEEEAEKSPRTEVIHNAQSSVGMDENDSPEAPNELSPDQKITSPDQDVPEEISPDIFAGAKGQKKAHTVYEDELHESPTKSGPKSEADI